MSMWDVEAIQPKAHERINRAERARCGQLDASWKRAACRARHYREERRTEKSYDWEDKASALRAAYVRYCDDIDKKYNAPHLSA